MKTHSKLPKIVYMMKNLISPKPIELAVKSNSFETFIMTVSTVHTLPICQILKKKILRKCSKPGFENLVLIYFKFQHNGFVDFL